MNTELVTVAVVAACIALSDILSLYVGHQLGVLEGRARERLEKQCVESGRDPEEILGDEVVAEMNRIVNESVQ